MRGREDGWAPGKFAAHGIGLSDFAAVHHLAEAPGGRLRRVDLAQRLALSPSGVTRLLARSSVAASSPGKTNVGGRPRASRSLQNRCQSLVQSM